MDFLFSYSIFVDDNIQAGTNHQNWNTHEVSKATNCCYFTISTLAQWWNMNNFYTAFFFFSSCCLLAYFLFLFFLWELFCGCCVVLSPCWLMQTLSFPSGAKTTHAQSSFNIYSSSLHPFLPQLLHREKPQRRLCRSCLHLCLSFTWEQSSMPVTKGHQTMHTLSWKKCIGD